MICYHYSLIDSIYPFLKQYSHIN